MFTQLKELSEKAKINLFIKSKDDGKMEVIVFFEVQSSKDETFNIAPLMLEGTPEELERDFVHTLDVFTKQNISSLERISFVTSSIKKAEEEATAKATAGTKKKATTKAEPKKEEPKKEVDLFAPVEEESKATPQEKVEAVAKVVEPKQVTIEEAIVEVEAEIVTAPTVTATLTEPKVEEPKVEEPKVSERTLERIEELKEYNFTITKDGNEYSNGGISLAATYVEKAEDSEWDRAMLQMREMRAKVQEPQQEKPTKSFSEFKAEADVIEFDDEIPSIPVKPNVPVEKTIEQKFDDMVQAFKDAGYGTDTLDRKTMMNEETIKTYLQWLNNNPLPAKS